MTSSNFYVYKGQGIDDLTRHLADISTNGILIVPIKYFGSADFESTGWSVKYYMPNIFEEGVIS